MTNVGFQQNFSLWCWVVLADFHSPAGKHQTGTGFIFQHDNHPEHGDNAEKAFLA